MVRNVDLDGLQSLSARGSGAINIATMLRNEILEGRYAFGDRLPAERDLASFCGASRGTVREALRRLEENNLVSRRIGSGTFVSYRERPDHEHIAETTSPLELIEVRLALEPHMVRLAVMNASARDIERLREALGGVVSSGNSPERFSRADETFHLTLAGCARNPIMQWLYRHINDVRGHSQWAARKDKILTPERMLEYNGEHQAIFQAVHSRDTDSGVAAITRHLERARSHLLGETEAVRSTSPP